MVKTMKKKHVELLIKDIFESLELYTKKHMFSCQGNAICIGNPMLNKLLKLKEQIIVLVKDY